MMVVMRVKPESTHTIIRIWDRVADRHGGFSNDAAVVVKDAGGATWGVGE